MKNLICFLILLLCSGIAPAQAPRPYPANNTLYAEACGTAGKYSFGYDRILLRLFDSKVMLGANIGASYWELDGIRQQYLFPTGVNLLLGKPPFYAEIAYDYLWGYNRYFGFIHPVWTDWFPDRHRHFVRVGARIQQKNGGLFVKAYVFPITVTIPNEALIYLLDRNFDKLYHSGEKWFPWGGLSVGYTFRIRKQW